MKNKIKQMKKLLIMKKMKMKNKIMMMKFLQRKKISDKIIIVIINYICV